MLITQSFIRLTVVVAIGAWVFWCPPTASAQPEQARFYREAAQAARNAAAQYRAKGCNQAASCMDQFAAANDCLAAQLGPNGPRSCPSPTCAPDCAAARGETTSGGTNPTGTTNTGQQTAAQQQAQIQQAIQQIQQNMKRAQDAANRDQEVEQQIQEEREERYKLKPTNMNPDGKDVGGLLDGDAKKLGSTADLAEREKRFGDASGRSIETLSDPELTDRMKTAVNDDSNYREFGEEPNKPITGTALDGKPLSEMTDAELADLYSPESKSKPDGWGNPTDITPEMYKDAPPITEIEFFRDGKVVVKEYDQKVYSQLEFPSSNPDRDLRSTTVSGGTQSAVQTPTNSVSQQSSNVKVLSETISDQPDSSVPRKIGNPPKTLYEHDKADDQPGETTTSPGVFDRLWQKAKEKYQQARETKDRWVNNLKEGARWIHSPFIKGNEWLDQHLK